MQRKLKKIVKYKDNVSEHNRPTDLTIQDRVTARTARLPAIAPASATNYTLSKNMEQARGDCCVASKVRRTIRDYDARVDLALGRRTAVCADKYMPESLFRVPAGVDPTIGRRFLSHYAGRVVHPEKPLRDITFDS
eukprot:6179524-Pleurochrysis_carterae.AAC.3